LNDWLILQKNITMSGKINSFLDVIFTRKSVRSYTGKVIQKGDLEILLKAAMATPSGRNQQPWAFIAITDPSILIKLADGLPYAKMLPQAGSAIVVCGYSVPPSRPGSKDLWEQDCAAATQNILLAAEALNLGAVWTAVHPYPDRQEFIRQVLNIPREIYPFCVIPVGYPTGEEKPKDKFDSNKIHWEGW
jgi:nitroreductase